MTAPTVAAPRPTTVAEALALGLSEAEFAAASAALARPPTPAELAVLAGMWSEHCSYKSSRHLLRGLPQSGPRVLAGPGAHAGVVDVGEGWAVAFKIESHNHPSAVDPYQGAATGVGGILRDIIAQGARPCALLDSLCFGDPRSPRTRHLQRGIIDGIAGYGNAIGVPNVGGQVSYDRRYEENPLVNVLAAGLVRHGELRTARAQGIGNALVYVGATTGRDGVLGAAFASEALRDPSQQVAQRTQVQVGDPFSGKKLLEACVHFSAELGMIAGQDLGACGLSCAVFEMAALGGLGATLELDAVPLREPDMSPIEILLSESQERFLFVVRAGAEEAALQHFHRHGLHAAVIGRLCEGTRVKVRARGAVLADLPAALVAGGAPPSQWPLAPALPAATVYPDFPVPTDLAAVLLTLLALPEIADKEPIYSRFDQTVGNRTVRGPGQASAAVLRLPASARGFALVLTGRGQLCAADPYLGMQAAVATALRRLACAGAELVAVSDGLNCASPRDPLESRRLAELIAGLGDALRTLGVPVTGGNVSLYNESPSGPIPPTPMLGGLGLVKDTELVPSAALQPGLTLLWLGAPRGEPVTARYGELQTGLFAAGLPAVDLAAERRLADFLVAQAQRGRIRASQPTGVGGMAVALAKLCLRGGCGARLQLPAVSRPDWLLFGEYPAQAWVAVPAAEAAAFCHDAEAAGVPWHSAGTSGGEVLELAGLAPLPLDLLLQAFSPKSSHVQS
jgi:phosphoribosylformylglycinamidine synthase